jgi:hypothetical protein
MFSTAEARERAGCVSRNLDGDVDHAGADLLNEEVDQLFGIFD